MLLRSIRYLLFLGIVLFSEVVKAQNPYFLPKILQNTPNSAALGKFGNYEVNMFSGVPEISVPLYEVESGGLKVPITLSYHASGQRVIDVASWVGLGWSLNAGGEIGRRTMGNPDDDTNGYLQGYITQAAQSNNLNDNTTNGRLFMAQVKAGNMDTQPDIFSYNFPGHSGKFFFNGQDNFKPAFLPFAPLKVTRSHPANFNGINSMTVADEKGTKYFFGVTAQNLGDFSSGGSSHSSVSSWLLEKMVTQDFKDSVSFAYYPGAFYSMPADPTEFITVDDQINNIGAFTNQCAVYPYQANQGSGSVSQNGSFVTERLLNTILFKNGKAVFELSSANRLDIGNKSLQDIKIYALNPASGQYQLLKTIWFYKSYFIKGTDVSSQKLRLDSLAIMDQAGSVVQKYRFAYNPVGLPNYTSKGKDYWGYYNGKVNQSSLIPRTTIDYNTSLNSDNTPITIGSNTAGGRDPVPDSAQACMLQRIYYPTGGYTDFQFEGNSYLVGGVKNYAGGLRVAVIKSYDGINPTPITKIYQYASARPNFHLGNYTFSTSQLVRWISSCAGMTQTMRRRTFVSVPTTDIEAWDSTPVAYNTVTETVVNGVANTGKTIYQFSDQPDVLTSATLYGKPIYNSYFFARGQLQTKSIYVNLNGNYRIVRREQMTYAGFKLKGYNGAGLVVGKYAVNDGVSGYDFTTSYGDLYSGVYDSNNFRPSYYDILSDDTYLTSKTVTDYDADTTKSVVSTELRAYDNFIHQQPSRIYHNDSKGNMVVNRMKYPADYLAIGGTTTGHILLDSMLSRNMQNDMIEKWDSVKYASPASAAVTSGQLNTYKTGALTAILPDQVKRLNITTPVTNFDTSRVSAGQIISDTRYEKVISFDQYDSNNNLLQYTPRNTTPTSVIWDYQKSLPVAEIKNATVNQIAFTGFEAGGKGNWTYSGTPVITTGAPGGSRAYSLSSGSVTASGLPAGKNYIVAYWSSAGPATVTSPGTAASSVIRSYNGWTYYQHKLPATATSVTVSGAVTIDELRLYPAEALMSTYNYTPLVGMTSTTDPKGQTTIYEYDSFQRLLNVRDQNNNIVKNYTYNYPAGPLSTAAPVQLYYNLPRSPSIQKNDCGSGAIGSFVTFNVPGQMFSSTVSQADAEQQATNYVNTAGQTYANTNGNCITNYGNVSASGNFTKNNCGVGLPGTSYTYTVPANMFHSTVSQAAADQLAQDDINTHGQLAANEGGSCPNGTDVANWSIGYNIFDSGGHTVRITVSRPSGDINNINRVNYRIHMISGPDLTGFFDMPSGVTSYMTNATFSVTMTGNVVSIAIDSIN